MLPPGCDRSNGLSDPSTGSRDPARWPFASSSPWNTPLGTEAAFAPADDPQVRSLVNPAPTAWINATSYSQPLYYASKDDPVVTVHEEHCPDARFRMPLHAKPAAGTDANLNVVDPTHSYVDECWDTKGEHPDLTCGRHVRTDLRGQGFGEGGTRAARASAIGGLIRTWELRAGRIRHALALSLPAGDLARGPVWPATEDDADAEWTYNGSVHMGSLVALPADVDISGLGLDRSGRVLATALQDFGAYVIDKAGSANLYAEPGLEGSRQLDSLRKAWPVLRKLLRVVVNNGPEHPGGPGERRAPGAPPLA